MDTPTQHKLTLVLLSGEGPLAKPSSDFDQGTLVEAGGWLPDSHSGSKPMLKPCCLQDQMMGRHEALALHSRAAVSGDEIAPEAMLIARRPLEQVQSLVKP